MPDITFKAWLVNNGISQTELAKLLGVSFTAVNAKVNGRSQWTLPQVKKICTKYNLSADIFVRECCD